MRGNKLTDKSPLEQKILTGIHGPPQLKREERQHLLGQFRERVLKVLTFEQIVEPGTYPEIIAAMTHPKARRLLISRRVDSTAAAKYIRLARKHGLSFATVDLPEFKGPVGLVVAAAEAVDIEDISVPSRTQRLLEAGVPQEIIAARGQGLCKACLELLKEVAPGEEGNYRKLNLLDRLMGNQCPCKKKN